MDQPVQDPILQFFTYSHLPEACVKVAKETNLPLFQGSPEV